MELQKILSGHKIINLVHVVGVGPMLLIIGLLNVNDLCTHITGYLLIIISIIIILYHSGKYLNKYKDEFGAIY